MSSQDVLKSVSKKLKYYMEVKRLEDGFDLSGPDQPRLDHPPHKARPIMSYAGLQDRPLKHYFRPDMRVTVTQLKTPDSNKTREKQIRKKLVTYMQKYKYLPPQLGDAYYTMDKKGNRRLRADSVPYGIPMRKSKSPHRGGGYPVLRSVPTAYMSRSECERLINHATKLLTAAETGNDQNKDKDGNKKMDDASSTSNTSERGAPRSFESNKSNKSTQQERGRPRTSKSRRRQNAKKQKSNKAKALKDDDSDARDADADTDTDDANTDDANSGRDSAYSTPATMQTIDGQQADDQKVKPWLKKQMQESDVPSDDYNTWLRPQSAEGTRPHPPETQPDDDRPASASRPRRPRPMSAKRRNRPTASEAWGSDTTLEGSQEVNSQGVPTEDIGVQTGGELLKDYSAMDRVLTEGDQTKYEIHVWTGDRPGASTRADIKVALFGDRGRTEDTYLDESLLHKVKFQKGQEDAFKLDTYYVGPLRKIAIGHDKKNIGFGWYLERVVVKDVSHSVIYECVCDSWLSAQTDTKLTFKQFEINSSSSFRPEAEGSDTASEALPLAGQTVSYEPATPTPRSDDQQSVSGVKSASDPANSSHTSLKMNTSTADPNDDKPVSSSSSQASETITETAETTSHTTSTATNSKPPIRQSYSPRRRSDDFFDQESPKQDFSSVLESISQTTEADNRSDFESDRPMKSDRSEDKEQVYKSQAPHSRPLRLIDTTEQTEPKNKMYPDTDSDTETEDSDRDSDSSHSDSDSTHSSHSSQSQQINKKSSDDSKKPPPIRKSTDDDGTNQSGDNKTDSDNKAATKEENLKDVEKPADEDKTQRLLFGPSIHDAAKTGDIQTVRDWLEEGKSHRDKVNELGWTPLHIACHRDHGDVVELLLKHGAQIEAQTPTGNSPMHVSAQQNSLRSMKVLLQHGASINTKSTADYQTPLHLAAMGGNYETVKWLVANDADLDIADFLGRVPEDVAEEYGHQDVRDFLRLCQHDRTESGSVTEDSTAQRRGSRTSDRGGLPTINEDPANANQGALYKGKEPLSSRSGSSNVMKSRSLDVYNGNDEDEDAKHNAKHDEDLMMNKKR